MDDHLVIREARITDLARIYKFFLSLEEDLVARKFYRYLPCNTFPNRLKALLLLFIKLFLNNDLSVVLLKRYFIMILGLIDDKVIGVCHIETNLIKGEGTYGIAILRDYRGRRIGYKLSSYAIMYAKKLGVNRIILTVDSDNITALKLYKKLGFRVIDYIERGDYRYTTKEFVDFYKMELVM